MATTKGLAEIDAFAKLARAGLKLREIAAELGMTISELSNTIHRTRGLYALWLECKPARHARNVQGHRDRVKAREAEKQRRARRNDGSGPIPASLKELAREAAEARRKREEEEERVQKEEEQRRKDVGEHIDAFLSACKALADSRGCVAITEVAEALGWKTCAASRLARRAVDAGLFPYRLKAREVEVEVRETPDEADVPMLGLVEIWGEDASPRFNRKPDYSEENAKTNCPWRAEPTPALASDPERIQSDVARYLREWKVGTKTPEATAEAEAEAKAIAHRESVKEWKRKSRQKQNEYNRRSRAKRKTQCVA